MVNESLSDASPVGLTAVNLWLQQMGQCFLSVLFGEPQRNQERQILIESPTQRSLLALIRSNAASIKCGAGLSSEHFKSNATHVNPMLKVSQWFLVAFWTNYGLLSKISLTPKALHDLASLQVS